ncbi:MAG: hypothetical protein MUO63_12180, partial [Desulfobulbaceae bacterium]|nr:hypothetical protein [Desulfobulbaceae bacterium]
DEAGQELTITFDDNAAWAAEVGGFMMVRMSRPQNPTRNFFAGPFIYAGALVGAVIPISSPLPLACPTPIVEGHNLWLSARIARADGRLSEAWQVGPTPAVA